MITRFTAHMLIDDGSSTNKLVEQSIQSFEARAAHDNDSGHQILLQSGFPTLNPESSIPLSSALQLNADLASFDSQALLSFAEAERMRVNGISFSSYTIEPDKRVCVLSDSSSDLERFIDCYGGVLEIVPLLTKGSHRDFEPLTDLSISEKENRFHIHYSVRAPVDFSRCTYCGQCGRICPEQCIDPTLFFDFERCTFCRDCESACPVDAIDIYAAVEKKVAVSALIILGETKAEVPEHSPTVYRQNEIESYFSTLHPSQVDEVITCNHSICQFSSRSRSGCELCIEICPSNAISGGETIAIDSLKCIECGKCAGICPTGALCYSRLEDHAFVEFFRTFELKKDMVVVVGSSSALHETWWSQGNHEFKNYLFLEFPNINAFSDFHILFLLSHGASNVVLLHPDSTQPQVTQDRIKRINSSLKTILNSTPRVWTLSPQTLSSLHDSLDLISPFKSLLRDLNYLNRRDTIASIFKSNLNHLPNDLTITADPEALFHSVLCDEDVCTQCLACLNECNIDSLTADPSQLTLSWTGALCTGCKACIDICPENALSGGNEIRLTTPYFQPEIIAQAEPMRCKGCGKVFGTKKSFDRVMEILAQKNLDHDGHFEFCEDCRVLKLLESE